MKIKLNDVRVAFAGGLLEKTSIAGSEPAFQARALIEKDSDLVDIIKAAELEVANEKWGGKAANNLKAIRANQDGLLKDGDSKANLEGFAGMFFVNFRSKVRPTVVDQKKTVVSAEDGLVYSGCYMNIHLDVWAQDNQYGKKINATVTGAQFVRDGDAFSGTSAPSDIDDFDDLDAGDSDDLIG